MVSNVLTNSIIRLWLYNDVTVVQLRAGTDKNLSHWAPQKIRASCGKHPSRLKISNGKLQLVDKPLSSVLERLVAYKLRKCFGLLWISYLALFITCCIVGALARTKTGAMLFYGLALLDSCQFARYSSISTRLLPQDLRETHPKHPARLSS